MSRGSHKESYQIKQLILKRQGSVYYRRWKYRYFRMPGRIRGGLVMYRIVYTRQAAKDIMRLKSCGLDQKARELLEIMKKNSFQNLLRRSGKEFPTAILTQLRILIYFKKLRAFISQIHFLSFCQRVLSEYLRNFSLHT